MIRAGFMYLAVLGLVGCDMVNHDRTLEPAMAPLVNHSYVINKDSFLLENYCLNEYTTHRCMYMQAIGGSIRVFKGLGNSSVALPKSFDDYEQNKAAFAETLRDNNIFHQTKYWIVAKVPKGTVIKVTKLVSIAEGEAGRAWAVFGQIESEGTDVSIQIGPGNMNQSFPWWFSSQGFDRYYLPPQPLPEFLSEQ